MCVCVCVRKREKERERKIERKRDRQKVSLADVERVAEHHPLDALGAGRRGERAVIPASVGIRALRAHTEARL